MRRVVVASVLVGASVGVAVACGSGDDDKPGGGDVGADATTGADGATAQDGSTAQDGGTTQEAGVDARPPPNVGTWRIVHAPVSDNLYAVWGTGPTNVYAVGGEFEIQGGYGGSVVHLKPGPDGGPDWFYEQNQFVAGAEVSFKDIAGTAPDRVFATAEFYNPGNPPSVPPSGGSMGWEWDGGGWTQANPGGNRALFGSPQTDMWGTKWAQGTATVVHFEGNAWVEKRSSTTETYGRIWAGGTHAFVVGQDDAAQKPIILHYDGATWTTTPSPDGHVLNGIWGSSPTDVFAVGENGTILHWDGQAWTAQKSNTTQGLAAVWGSSAYDVFAVGPEGAMHYENDTWQPETLPDAGAGYTVRSIWGSGPSDVYAVGHKGTIFHRSP